MAQDKKKNTTPKAPDKKKQIIIGIICAIVALNVMWTIMQNKFTPKLDSVKADIADVVQKVVNFEKNGIPDVADLKAEFSTLKMIADNFSDRLEQLIKLEEDQLSALEAQVEAQKARVEALKKLSAASATAE